jgi:hypothetical protein
MIARATTINAISSSSLVSRSAKKNFSSSSSSSSFAMRASVRKAIDITTNRKNNNNNNNNNNRNIITRSSLADQHAYEVISNLAKGGGGIPGVDTTQFDQMFINVASFILPAWGIIVGTIFVFGTIAKVAFPEKYDEMTTKAEKESFKGQIDLDNLSEDDLAAVAELEAEMKAKGKM